MGNGYYNVSKGAISRQTISGKLIAAAAAVILAVSVYAGISVSAASTVQVEALDGTQGWTKVQRDTGTVDITNTYGAPTGFGVSSLEFDTTTSNDKAYVKNVELLGDSLSSLESITYSTFRDDDSTATAGQAPALNVEIINPDGSGYTTLVYEPIYQADGAAGVVGGEWQNWDAYESGEAIWWSTRDINGVNAGSGTTPYDTRYVSWSQIVENNPNAVILSVMINQGGGNSNLSAAADGLVLNDTAYDFELEAADTTAPVAEITSPADGAEVRGVVAVTGEVTDENPMNSYFKITGPDGYVTTSLYTDGRDTHTFEWDTTGLVDGEYNILFETRDQAGNKDGSAAADGSSVDRITVSVDNVAEAKADCKNGGYVNYGFKNQGQCIASIQSNEKSRHNR